jgi:hypothetical protein
MASGTKTSKGRGRKKYKALTPEQRETARKEQREKVEKACQQLLTSDGWRRWVRVRATNGLNRYSRYNQFFLALQGMERKLELSYVTGFKAFTELGYVVRKGEKALWVLAPRTVIVTDDEDDSRGKAVRRSAGSDRNVETDAKGIKRRTYFRAVPVFDASQVDEIPEAKVVELTAPGQPIDGDSHAHLLEPLKRHAAELGFKVEERRLEDTAAGGWCDYKKKLIVYGAGAPNKAVRVLVHELAHAHGVSYKDYNRKQAEVMVDTVTHIVLSSAGLDVSSETVPYISGWGETGELEAITTYAEVIDTIAGKLEEALQLPGSQPAADTSANSNPGSDNATSERAGDQADPYRIAA